MAAHRKRPIPSARMADLLVDAKRELLDQGVDLTPRVFDAAWRRAWEAMVEERAWPHATEHRRQWRSAMIACKSEMRAAFLDVETPYSRISETFVKASERVEVDLTPADMPRAFIGAITAYGATDPSEAPGVLAQEAMTG